MKKSLKRCVRNTVTNWDKKPQKYDNTVSNNNEYHDKTNNDTIVIVNTVWER